jgi:steroid delta-isomerase-like uncharacterized protein
MQRRAFVVGATLAAAGLAESAAAEDAVSIVDRFAATLSAHDIAGFGALYAEDCVNHQRSAAAPALPAGKSAKQATLDFFSARLVGVPDLRVSVETSVVSGDKAAASFVYEGTHGGTYFGVAATGRTLRFTSCDILRIQDGRIVEHWGMGDIAGILAQLKG